MLALKLEKNKLILAAIVIASAVFLIFIGSAFSWRVEAADQGTQADKRVLNVAGQGTVEIAPDIAYVTLGAVTEDRDAKAAQQKNADIMAKVVTKIKAAGIEENDIKTVNYSIYPKYNYIQNTGVSEIVGYTVNNSVKVTVRDIAKAGSIIDAAADSGANTSNSISFGLSDYEKYYNQALKKAVEAAKQRAKTIADAMGISIKQPSSISESGGYEPIYNYGMAMDSYKAVTAAAPTPVQSGSITVRANISVTYEY